jgi:hypothetical protein
MPRSVPVWKVAAMKTNNTIRRFGALILIGSIAVLTVSAADTTTATDKPAANTMPTAEKSAWKHHHRHHRHHCPFADTGSGRKGATSAWGNHIWLGAIAEDSRAHGGYIHHPASVVRLTRVFHHGPAYDAGLRDGDVIWKFDGTRLWSTEQLRYELHHEKQGGTVPVEIFRDGKREELNVTLGTPRHAKAEPSCTYVPKAG